MAFRYLFGLIIFFLIGCSKQKNTTNSLLDFTPDNAAIIIKINDLKSFKGELKNNDFISKFESSTVYKNLQNQVMSLDFVETNSESLLAFSELGANNFEFTFVCDNPPNTFTHDSTQVIEKEPITNGNQTIYKYSVEENQFYGMEFNTKTIFSSSQLVLENLIKYYDEKNKSEQLEKLYKIAGNTKTASVLLNLERSQLLLKTLLLENSELQLSAFSDWISLDFNSGQNHLYLNGISTAKDSTTNFLNLLKGTNPLTNLTPSFAPVNADAVLSYTFDNYNIFARNQQQNLKSKSPKDSLFNTIEEIGFIYQNNSKAILLNTFGAERLSDYITTIKKSETDYQGNQILELNNPDFLNTEFDPIIKDFKANFCTLIENAFIFSSNIELLHSIINNKKNNATFEKTDIYNSAKDVLANESSILFVANSSGIEQTIKEDLSKNLQAEFKKAALDKNTFAAQVVADEGFFHINLLIQQTGRKKKINTVSPLFTVQLDDELATNPQFVINHRTKRKEIVVQDIANNLYLISSTGKVIWKKQLGGMIQGKVHQVDLYKNKRLQLAFTTNDQFIILDRNGKEVLPFNKKFEGGNLNELAVFDYDNNKNYRLVVTQGDKVFMYDRKGSIVKGFKFTQAESAILNAPKHFRIAKKDYLVFTLENGTLKILNRIGNVRTKVSNKIEFSENEVYLYKNKFILTNKKGGLYQIAANSKLNKTELRLNADHGIDATSKTLVYMNDNLLNIKGKKVELDFGVYTKPRIFYIYDKIYVSVTDIQNQKIYLYDSQAKPISNFPVFGSSLIDITDMENDRKLEVVTQDQKNSIIVYQMN